MSTSVKEVGSKLQHSHCMYAQLALDRNLVTLRGCPVPLDRNLACRCISKFRSGRRPSGRRWIGILRAAKYDNPLARRWLEAAASRNIVQTIQPPGTTFL